MIFDIKGIFYKFVSVLSRDEVRVLDGIIHQKMPDYSDLYSEHLHYFYWENQVDFWDVTPSPVRLSRNDIKIYRDFLQKKKNKKNILILGATPELRDLVAEEKNTKIYLTDFSYRMPLAMLKFTNKVDPLKEIWIKANWLDLPFPLCFFDVILGDLALQQFPPAMERIFLKKISSLLKKNGVFVGLFHFLDDKMRKGTLEELILRTLNSRLTDQEKFILLKLRVLWFFATPEKRKLNRHISAKEFDNFAKEKQAKNLFLGRVRDAVLADKDSYRSWSPPEEKELVDILSKSFRILGKKNARDYEEARYYPIFSLGNKFKK